MVLKIEIYHKMSTCKKWWPIKIILVTTNIVLAYVILNKINNTTTCKTSVIIHSFDRIQWNGTVLI